MTPEELDEINSTILQHATMARVLMDHRRRLFDALMETTRALHVAERRLNGNSEYVAELIARRIPLDACARGAQTLEEVAHDPRMR